MVIGTRPRPGRIKTCPVRSSTHNLVALVIVEASCARNPGALESRAQQAAIRPIFHLPFITLPPRLLSERPSSWQWSYHLLIGLCGPRLVCILTGLSILRRPSAFQH